MDYIRVLCISVFQPVREILLAELLKDFLLVFRLKAAQHKVCLLYTSALRVRHAALINLAQKHLGKTLVDLSQRVIKGCRLFGGSHRRDGRHELFDCLFTNGCLSLIHI